MVNVEGEITEQGSIVVRIVPLPGRQINKIILIHKL